MRKMFAVTVVMALSFAASLSAAETWRGKISDSSCGVSHDTMTEHGTKGTDKQCTAMCIMKGAKYVFVRDGNVLKIANQDFKGLQEFAGDTVRLTGNLKGDVITVTKVEQAK